MNERNNDKVKTIATAEAEGAAAQKIGAPIEHNPYDHEDEPDEYESWEHGWKQSAGR